MNNALGQIADFVIKIIMMFTTVLALLFFAEKYSMYSFTLSFVALIFVLAIITKGLGDIFTKE